MIATEIHESGLDGVFARADGDRPLRGVLALGGSDGGVPAYWARLLAAERFASLALAYFNTPNTQPALTEVPLERLERTLRWLREQPGVATNDGRVGVLGVSKGAELALLLAATFPGPGRPRRRVHAEQRRVAGHRLQRGASAAAARVGASAAGRYRSCLIRKVFGRRKASAA